MEEKSDTPQLRLVDQNYSTEHDQEFIPLPFYSWEERPESVPLDVDEVATAVHLAMGDVPRAAELLKVAVYKVDRLLRHHPRLQRILLEHQAIALHRASAEYIRALDDPSDRRREWAAKSILATWLAQGHPFSPAPANSVSTSVNISAREVVYSWRSSDQSAILDHADEGRDGSDDLDFA